MPVVPPTTTAVFPCKSKMEELMRGAVFFQDRSAAIGLTVDTLSATLSLYLRQSAGEKKWLPKKSSGSIPKDNVLVALTDLPAGEAITFAGEQYIPPSDIPAKQKFAIRDLAIGDEVIMYGGIVGLVRQPIPRGGLLSTRNVQHDASGFGPKVGEYSWTAPDVSAWASRTFDGYHRADGQVGTRNYWLVIPLVFCENRNVEALRDAFEEELGYGRPKLYRQQVRQLIEQHHQGSRATERKDLSRRQNGCFRMSTESGSWCMRAAAVAPGRMRRRSAGCLPAIFIIPTLPAPRC